MLFYIHDFLKACPFSSASYRCSVFKRSVSQAKAVREVIAEHPETINAKHRDGRTALHFGASIMGSAEIVANLIAAKANVNAKDANGATALHFAAAGGHKNVAMAVYSTPGGVRGWLAAKL